MNHKTIVIKKYENRRLYDTTNSRYINLDEVAQAVQDGAEVQVLDATTGEDITRLVLTQIIVEGAKRPNSSLPLDMLRQMVIASGRASQEGALMYMKAVSDMYQSAYRSIPQPFNPLDFIQNMMNPASRQAASSPPPAASETPKTSSDEAAKEDAGQESGELKRRVAELENLVAKLAGESREKNRSQRPGSRSRNRR